MKTRKCYEKSNLDHVVGTGLKCSSLVVRVLDLGEEFAPVDLNEFFYGYKMHFSENKSFEMVENCLTSASLLRSANVSSMSLAAIRPGT